MLVGLHWVSKKAKDGGDGKSGVLPTTWMVLFQRTISRTPGWAKITSLHKCLVGSNTVAPEGSHVAPPEHPQEPEGEANLHGRSQGAQTVRKLAELD